MIIPALDLIDGTVVRLHQGITVSSATTAPTRCRACRITPPRVRKCCIWWI
jgi:phosphoribosylformimino-5-aminoimidazole carboxamide ribonucleotide (ProFAR) isomerase